MIRHFFLIAALAACAVSLQAQSYLVNVLKPTDSKHMHIGTFTRSPMGNIEFDSKGFSLEGPDGGLIGNNEHSWATYNLGGKYEKVSFWLGPYAATENSNQDGGSVIVTVLADGKRLLDQVVHCVSTPEWIVLDVKGVDELKFQTIKGGQTVFLADIQLWTAGQTPVTKKKAPADELPAGKRIQLAKDLVTYFQRYNGHSYRLSPVPSKNPDLDWMEQKKEGISINRKKFDYGIQFHVNEGLSDEKKWSYFWLNKRYDKLSFIVGPRDNQSQNASAWLSVKADKKIIWEGIVRQDGLAEQVVLDVKGVNSISFYAERRSSDLLGGMTLGVVDIFAYPSSDMASLPQAGTVNVNKEKISKLPDVCPLMSNIRPYSVRGMSKADNTLFYGETTHYTFSMGGERFYEGFLLTTGNTLLADQIDSYAEFDLAGEFDWLTFDAGTLSKAHRLDDDQLRIYADGRLIFDKTIYCTWPNQHYELPLNRCRKLRFEKPGNGKKNQTIIGVADIVVSRGKPCREQIFEHTYPELPYETDLIDLCEKPYFHYNGRYSGSITGWSMDQCFYDGSTITRYFQMKDGSQINKGFMLEANVPLGLEDITFMDGIFMFFCGAGGNLSSSDVAAHTGTTGGASPTTSPILSLFANPDKKQAAACAFNPYGAYQTCTFTVANKSEYVDELAKMAGQKQSPPVKLNVFADQRLVGQYWLSDKMVPTTFQVPIYNCKQLLFWLEPNDVRSGQYVFYDLKVSKAPCAKEPPTRYISADERNAKQSSSATKPSVNNASPKKSSSKSSAEEEAKKKRRRENAARIGLGILDAVLGE